MGNTSDSGVGNTGDGSVSNDSVGGVAGDGGNVSNSVLNVGRLDTDGDMDGFVDGGGVSGNDGLGRVDVVGGVVDVGGLDNLLDGVDLVGSGDGDSPGHSNLVGGGHVLVHNDLTLNRDGDMDGDINVVVLDIDLGDDVGLLGSDPGVGPHGSEDLLLDHGICGSGSVVDGRGRDGSDVGGSVGDDGRGKSTGHNLVSDISVLHTLLDNGSSSSVGVMSLSYHGRGRHHRGAMGHSRSSSVGSSVSNGRSSSVGRAVGDTSDGVTSGVGGSAEGAGHEGKSDHKSVHVV